ncbi:multidrug transporter subunit MdtA, partial [Yersinia enterocolitica]
MKAQSKRTSRLLMLLGAVVAIIVAVFVWRHFSAAPQSSAPGAQQVASGNSSARAGGRRNMPMSPVQAATATEQAVPRYLTGLGTVIAANTV